MLAEIIGPDALIIVGVIALVLLFGGKQLPKLARSVGSAQKEFKKGLEQGDEDEETTADKKKSD
jgi:sec-independent protein translocase protein TatA